MKKGRQLHGVVRRAVQKELQLHGVVKGLQRHEMVKELVGWM